MGRPIKRKFFGTGNVNDGNVYNNAGGEGITSLTISNAGGNYSTGAKLTFAPSTIGGDAPTATISLYQPLSTSNLAIQYANVTSAGSGYFTAPAVTIAGPANVTVATSAWSGNAAGNVLTVSSTTGLYVGMHTTGVNLATTSHIIAIYKANSNVIMSSGNIGSVTGNVTFYDRGVLQGTGSITAVLAPTTTSANTIQANAWITGGTIGKVADIVAQRSSRRYKINNADGFDSCHLVPQPGGSPSVAAVTAAKGPTAEGEMTIQATDSAGGTYWVSKIESRSVTVQPGGTGTPGTQFAANSQPIWTSTSAPVANVSVRIGTNN